MKNVRFTSHLARTRGGIGFYADDRDNNRLEEMGCTVGEERERILPGEMRRWNKLLGQGQRIDFCSIVDVCACCGQEASLNIVSLCGECAREEVHRVSEVAAQERWVRHHVARHKADAHFRIHGKRMSFATA